MKRFRKNPAAGVVSLPTLGVIQEDAIIVGDSFAKYAPHWLLEIPDTPVGRPLESREPRGPVLLTEPAPVGPPKLEESAPPVPVKRGRGRPRKYPLPT